MINRKWFNVRWPGLTTNPGVTLLFITLIVWISSFVNYTVNAHYSHHHHIDPYLNPQAQLDQMELENDLMSEPSTKVEHYYYGQTPHKRRKLKKLKKIKSHHYHPIVLYKKKKIPGKYWHEAQRRLVTKHGGLDILGDIVQLKDGRVLSGNFGQNIPNFNDGYLKPWELEVRLLKTQRRLVKSLMRSLEKMLHNPPTSDITAVKHIGVLH